jgi:hypothetical protein
LYTQAEWDNYTSGEDLTTDTAPDPLLFLPAGGYRHRIDGDVINPNSGGYWSSVVTGTYSHYMEFHSNELFAGYATNRAGGMSVRCVAE